MTGTAREISGRELLRDVRAGLDDFGLMRKYELTKRQLKSLLKQLADAGAVSFIEKLTLDLSVKALTTDIRSGLEPRDLSEKYAVTDEQLRGVCNRLVAMGLLETSELEVQPSAIADAMPSDAEHPLLPERLPIEPESHEAPRIFSYFPDAILPCLRRNAAEVTRFLDRGMDPNARDRHLRRPALIWAAGYGNIDAVSVLVEKGADVHATGKDGKTALHFATSKNHADVRDLLLSRGAIR